MNVTKNVSVAALKVSSNRKEFGKSGHVGKIPISHIDGNKKFFSFTDDLFN